MSEPAPIQFIQRAQLNQILLDLRTLCENSAVQEIHLVVVVKTGEDSTAVLCQGTGTRHWQKVLDSFRDYLRNKRGH